MPSDTEHVDDDEDELDATSLPEECRGDVGRKELPEAGLADVKANPRAHRRNPRHVEDELVTTMETGE